ILDKHTDGHDSSSEFATDIHASIANSNRCQFAQWYALPFRRVDENVLDVFHPAFFFFQAHHHRKLPVSFPYLGRLFAAESRLDDVLNIRNIQAEARTLCAIDFDPQLRHSAKA